MARLHDTIVCAELAPDSRHAQLLVVRRHLGNERRCVITQDIVRSADFQTLTRIGLHLTECFRHPVIVARGEGERHRKRIVSAFPTALEWLLDAAGRSVARQRYKGLGEMNPRQLWETAMDPSARRLLQVQIEDAVAADRLFSILMGEEVGPRRSFIANHSKNVTELDV
jgi:DNA gyrase subunit B